MKYIYLKRLSDGVVLDIPEDQAEETLKRGGFERVADIVFNHVTPPTVQEYGCPLCERTFKTEQGLRVHKASHK